MSRTGSLTSFLQYEFIRQSPADWTCRRETVVLPGDLERVLGYAPRADVLLERRDGSRRIWIEFEVSRADPVANHAKFATAHLFCPQPPTDAFLAMVSPHVTRGRCNLAAATITLMRHIGMNAFQTALFPHLDPDHIKRLNHTALAQLAREQLPIEPEIERAMAVTEPLASLTGKRLHLAGDLLAVLLNVRQWNEEIQTPTGADRWGTRTVTYFIFDPYLATFAASKFCAYIAIPISSDQDASLSSRLATMTLDTYAQAEQTGRRLDGHEAREHLVRNLAMSPVRPEEAPAVAAHFGRWLQRHEQRIRIHPAGAIFLYPPHWLR